MKKRLIWTFIVLGLVIGGYYIWSETGRARNKKTGWTSLPAMKTHFEVAYLGDEQHPRKLIAIQPYLTPRSYSTPFNLYVTLYLYVRQLKESGLLDSQSVLVFPAHIGDGLMVCNEKEDVYAKNSLAAARSLIIRSNYYSYLSHYLSSPRGPERSMRAVFSMKAGDMSGQYQECFSELARTFGVPIVAGSILLPEPKLVKGSIQVGRGNMTEVAVVFDRTGQIVAPLYTTPAQGNFADSTKPRSYPLADGLILQWTKWISQNAEKKSLLVSLNKVNSGKPELDPPDPIDWPDSEIFPHRSKGHSPLLDSFGYLADTARTTVQVTLNGDLWDIPLSGAMLVNWRDSLYGWYQQSRKGRMLVCQLPD